MTLRDQVCKECARSKAKSKSSEAHAMRTPPNREAKLRQAAAIAALVLLNHNHRVISG